MVRAIARLHAPQIESIRVELVATVADSTDPRDWISCAVRAVTTHLDQLGGPRWYARFIAQVTADPSLHAVTAEEFRASAPSIQAVQDGVDRSSRSLPLAAYAERAAMMRHLITQMSVDHERALADGLPRSASHGTSSQRS